MNETTPESKIITTPLMKLICEFYGIGI